MASELVVKGSKCSDSTPTKCEIFDVSVGSRDCKGAKVNCKGAKDTVGKWKPYVAARLGNQSTHNGRIIEPEDWGPSEEDPIHHSSNALEGLLVPQVI